MEDYLAIKDVAISSAISSTQGATPARPEYSSVEDRDSAFFDTSAYFLNGKEKDMSIFAQSFMESVGIILSTFGPIAVSNALSIVDIFNSYEEMGAYS